MNSEFFVRIEEPKKLRKKLLETSREVVLLIQDHESIKRIKQEKIELLNEAAKTISEINMLIQKMKKLIPPLEGKKPQQKQQKFLEKEEVEVVTPQKTTLSELERLEQELKQIEEKIKEI